MPGVLKSLFVLLIEYFFNFTSPSAPLNEHCKREIKMFSYVSYNRLCFMMSHIKQRVTEVELEQIFKAIELFILEEPLKLVNSVATSDHYIRLHFRTTPDLYQTLLKNPHLRPCK